MYFLAHCINASVLVQDPDLFRYSFNLLEQTKKRSVPGASGGPDAALGGGLNSLNLKEDEIRSLDDGPDECEEDPITFMAGT